MGAATLSAHAGDLTCVVPKNQQLWVKQIIVTPASRKVTLHLTDSPSPRVAVLTNSTESQFGKPVYAFNLPPLPGSEPVTNLFKLFYTGSTWRLIDAGVLAVNGTFTLRAIGQSTVVECKESGL